MTTVVKRSALLSFSAQVLFDIVNDVARYPEFLPWCSSAEVHAAGGGEVTATLAVSGKGLTESFTTRNRLTPCERIDLELVDGPFQSFAGVWLFKTLGDAGCRVELELSFQFGGARRIFSGAFARVFTRAADELVDAFCQRARALHG